MEVSTLGNFLGAAADAVEETSAVGKNATVVADVVDHRRVVVAACFLRLEVLRLE